MKQLLSFIALSLCLIGNAQKTVTTYYDWNKIHPRESYTVNSVGQKNGLYKEYSQRGVVIAEYNYLNGELNGICSEYFEQDHNQRSLKVKATYKNGIKHGAYVEYYGPGILMRQGNYVNGQEEGTWTIVKEFDEYQPKGFEYYKKEVTMKNGEDVTTGLVKIYYYPSGKLFKELTKENGQVVSDQKMYTPDGKVLLLDKNGKDKVENSPEADAAIDKYITLMKEGGDLYYKKEYVEAKKYFEQARQLEEQYKLTNKGKPLHDAADVIKEIDEFMAAEQKSDK